MSKLQPNQIYNEIEAKPFTDILKLVKFPNKAEEELFNRLPLTDRQKEELLFDSIPELKQYSHLIKEANHEARELLRSESIPSSPPKLKRSIAAECISLIDDEDDLTDKDDLTDEDDLTDVWLSYKRDNPDDPVTYEDYKKRCTDQANDMIRQDHPELFPEEEDEESDNSVESKARPHKPDSLE